VVDFRGIARAWIGTACSLDGSCIPLEYSRGIYCRNSLIPWMHPSEGYHIVDSSPHFFFLSCFHYSIHQSASNMTGCVSKHRTLRRVQAHPNSLTNPPDLPFPSKTSKIVCVRSSGLASSGGDLYRAWHYASTQHFGCKFILWRAIERWEIPLVSPVLYGTSILDPGREFDDIDYNH